MMMSDVTDGLVEDLLDAVGVVVVTYSPGKVRGYNSNQ